jgi:outer membrane lipoprotein
MKKLAISLFLVLLAPAEEYASATATATQPSFAELQTHPEAYQGQEVILGGQVITARQDGDTLQLEIMQLPLADKNAPEANQALTQGRFLAFQNSGLSATAVSPGALVTVVGQVVGSAVTDPSQTNVLYPVLEVKTLTVWNQLAADQTPPPAVGQPPYPMQPPYPLPPPLMEAPPVMDNYYYTQYWDQGLAVWYWRPFWVYPWWTRPVVVVPPRVAIIRPHAVPFGRAPRIGPSSRGRLPGYIVPPIGHSRVLPTPGPRIFERAPRSAPYIVPPVGHSHVFPAPVPRSAPYIVPPIGHPRIGQPAPNGMQRESRGGRSRGSFGHDRGSPRR